MANFYYVKDDGTATGDAGRYTTQQTGSFATLGTANYYSTIVNAIAATTPPVAGDFINVSDLHSHSQSGEISYSGIVTTPFFIVCVDDTNIDAARTSGNIGCENTTGTSDVIINNQTISGMEFKAADNIEFRGYNYLLDCKLLVSASSDNAISLAQASSNAILVNCEVALDHVSSFNRIQTGCTLWMFGGSVTTDTAGVTKFFSAGFINGGGTAIFSGVDFSAITGTLVANVGADAAIDDLIDVRFDMCELASGVAFTNETFKSKDQRVLATRCSTTSAAAEHQYHLHTLGGDVDDDSTIRRADDPAFEDSSTKISYKIVTNADATLGSPLWFDFPNKRWSTLSAGATDTLRFYVASTAALTNADIYVDITYPDGTNKQTPNFFSSANTTVGGVIDFMAAGITLTTDSSSDWRDGGSALTGHNEYQIDVATSGNVGADTVVNVRVYITKASTTIQLASIYDLN